LKIPDNLVPEYVIVRNDDYDDDEAFENVAYLTGIFLCSEK